MLKKVLSISIAFMLLFSLCACDGDKGLEARLFYPIDKDPRYLDPQIIYDIGAKNIIANCFEGLVAIDAEGNIIPAAAERWETNPAATVYTFYLRQNMKWKVTSAAGKIIGEDYETAFDNRVTAHDFAFGLKRALLPETKCPEADSLFPIKNAKKVNAGTLSPSSLGIAALDDFTLEITLTNPDPDFLYTLLESYCMPCNEEFFEKTGGRYGLATRYLIYNGPFYINNWADDASVSVRKSDTYYDAENVYPYSVYFSINNEQPTRLKKLSDGTYSVSPFTESQAAELEGKKHFSVDAFDSSLTALVFNCSDPALSDLNIRQGIVSAFDYSVTDTAFGENYAKGIVPDSFLTGSVKFSEHRTETRKYLNASPLTVFKKGLENLEQKGIEVTVLCSTENENTVRALMQSWQSVLGISFTVYAEATDEVTLKERVKNGDFQLALTDLDFTGNRVYSLLSKFTSHSKENFLSFSDKAYDGILARMKKGDGIASCADAAKQAEQYLISNCAIVPLYETKNYYANGKNINGVIHNASGEILYFRNATEK